jgi:hypothetical protein
MKKRKPTENVSGSKKKKIGQIQYLNEKQEEKLKKFTQKYPKYNFKDSSEISSPFSNWMEWKFVYKMIFSNSIDQVNLGIDRISIWKKSENLLLHPIDSTMDFLILKYQSSNSSRRELNLSYGMAIVRMVDGFSKIIEVQQWFNSIHTLMENLDFPAILVKLRHMSSHEELPELSYLQFAGDIALDWLKERYWKVQYEILQLFELKVLKSIETKTLSNYLDQSTPYVVDILAESIIVKHHFEFPFFYVNMEGTVMI